MFLVLVLFLLMLVDPALRGLPFARLVTSTLFTLMYLSAVVAFQQSRRARLVLLSLGFVFLAFVWINSLFVQNATCDLIERILTAGFIGTLVVNLLYSFLRARQVTSTTIWHAIGCYLLLGFLWSALYRALVQLDPEAIRGLENSVSPSDFVYFSFTCLTTLGFGDVTPTAPVARSLVVLEAVVGPLYMAIVIAKLVSLYSASTSRATGDKAGPDGASEEPQDSN